MSVPRLAVVICFQISIFAESYTPQLVDGVVSLML